MKIHSYNFDGSWEESCKFCGETQQNHQNLDYEEKGVRHVYLLPCEAEKHDIRRRAVWFGFQIRSMALTYQVGSYLWGKIPFKEENRLVSIFCKHLYISIRAFFFLRRSKPK
tara:strand:+ start:690 stop:1025 length:336 start_codon:yes stop_codon:yes gene_type:complete